VTNASTAHATTSDPAAQLIMNVPNRVPDSPQLAMIRASTGNAVMAMATPRNSTNDSRPTPGPACSR
jgi:hypothetical protein